MPRIDHPPRVALVTGAGSALGRACTARLEAAGFTTVGGWRTTEPPGERSVQFDTTDADEVAGAVATIERRWGPLHTVVANAGISHLDMALRVPPKRFRKVVETNLTGALLLAQAALPSMVRRRAGRIVLIGSVAGHAGVPGVSAYAASKAGLTGLARTLSAEVGVRNITVNVVAPGLLDSAVDRLVEHRPNSRIDDRWTDSTPMRREGRCAEVAAVVAFLASDRARSVTGTTISVDGGFAMGRA